MADEPGTKTIQETSKRLKLHQLISVAMISLGVVGMISAANDPEGGSGPSSLSWFLVVGGIVWFFVTRFRIWWHHG